MLGPRLDQVPRDLPPVKPASRLLSPKARLLKASTGNRDPLFSGSEYLDLLLTGTPEDIAEEIMWSRVTTGMVENARKEIAEASRKSLIERGFPESFLVYRGGEPRSEIVPVTFSLSTAITHSRFHDRDGLVIVYRVLRRDILADVDVFQSCFFESELLVRRDRLEVVGHCIVPAP